MDAVPVALGLFACGFAFCGVEEVQPRPATPLSTPRPLVTLIHLMSLLVAPVLVALVLLAPARKK
ncbi:MAG: hypothetical protein IT348_02950 [Candidatus Eisenbacteria bacterium]|nr:hypothetical protein [Candidatus Eisenbacteria bacterium]